VEREAVMECLKREAKGKNETTEKHPTSPAPSVSTISATLKEGRKESKNSERCETSAWQEGEDGSADLLSEPKR
jgi:hypothetical protein